MRTIDILGVEVDAVTAPEALVSLRESLERGKRCQVVTVNSEMIMRAQHDLEFKEIINKADLRVPDSAGVVWAAKYLHQPLRGPLKDVRAYTQALTDLIWLLVWPSRVKTVLREIVPGSDLAVDIAAMCEEFGYTLFLLGGGGGTAEEAARTLRDRFPALKVAGTLSGVPADAKHDAQTRRAVGEANVVLVAFGAEKQERWIARNLPKLKAPVVAVGVGGTLDYLAGAASLEGGGAAKPPPGVVRRRGLEWLWRLFTQPSRWRRIRTAMPLFVLRAIRYKRQAHKVDS